MATNNTGAKAEFKAGTRNIQAAIDQASGARQIIADLRLEPRTTLLDIGHDIPQG